MTQEAVVLSNLPDGRATVAVVRGTACGANCGSCESCIYQNESHIVAANPLNAVAGSKVTIESASSLVYRAAIIVYILPVALLIAGYAIADLIFKAAEPVCVVVSFIAMLLGVAAIVFTQRNKKPIPYEIISIDRKAEGKRQ